MSLESRIIGVVQAIGLDIKSILTSLSSLTSSVNGKNQSVEVSGPGAVSVSDPGAINFTGSGVTATDNGGGSITLHISGGSGGGGEQQVFVQDTAPVGAVGPYMWWQTGLGDGTDMTLWVEDGQ